MSDDRIRVVLADDHPSVRAGIRLFIERDPGLEVIGECDDGRETLSAVRRLQPDVAVVDLQMPGLSGLEVITQARQMDLATNFMVLTAYDDDPYVFAALRAGAKGYLLKTAGPEELGRAIRMVHAGHPALDAGVAGRVMDRIGMSAGGTGLAEPEKLSDRELEVLRLAAEGLTNRAIGYELGISERTVHSHLMNVFTKLHVSSRTEAAMKAARLGWIAMQDK